MKAVTDLPEPDSPTMQTISPALDAEATRPRRVRAVAAGRQADGEAADVEDRGSARRPHRPLRHLGIERVAQAVAEHVHGEHGQREEDAGEQDAVRGDAEAGCGPRP